MWNIKTLSETTSTTNTFQIQRIVKYSNIFYVKQLKMDNVNDNKDSEINAR